MRSNPDNAPEKKEAYRVKLAAMDDGAFEKECSKMIWLSAYATNNFRSCFHWQADYCWEEARRRGKPEIYDRVHAALVEETQGR